MSDYSQPKFYRFNEDSLQLVRIIVESGIRAGNILDIGAGSGVIGIELAQKLNLNEAHFLELQREWEPYLQDNIARYIPNTKTEIFWTSIGEWVPRKKYDLIVSNPPYYLPQNGRVSPNHQRAHARSFLVDDWKVLLEKTHLALNENGHAYFITTQENELYLRGLVGESVKFHALSDLVILEFRTE